MRPVQLANRAMLFVSGLVALGGAASLAHAAAVASDLPGLTAGWAAVRGAALDTTLGRAIIGTIDRALGAATLGQLSVAAVCVALLLAVFLATRGELSRGRTLVAARSPGGTTSLDRSLASVTLGDALRRAPDARSVRVRARRVRRGTAVVLTVVAHPRADLGRLAASIDSAVREWDALTGTQLPIVVHVARARRRVRGEVSAAVR